MNFLGMFVGVVLFTLQILPTVSYASRLKSCKTTAEIGSTLKKCEDNHLVVRAIRDCNSSFQTEINTFSKEVAKLIPKHSKLATKIEPQELQLLLTRVRSEIGQLLVLAEGAQIEVNQSIGTLIPPELSAETNAKQTDLFQAQMAKPCYKKNRGALDFERNQFQTKMMQVRNFNRSLLGKDVGIPQLSAALQELKPKKAISQNKVRVIPAQPPPPIRGFKGSSSHISADAERPAN